MCGYSAGCDFSAEPESDTVSASCGGSITGNRKRTECSGHGSRKAAEDSENEKQPDQSF